MKKLIFSILIISLMILTGCEDKPKTLNDEPSTTTTINTKESTTTSITTKDITTTSSRKTTSTTKKNTTSTSSTSTTVSKTTKKIFITSKVIDKNNVQSYISGYKLCDDEKECICYFDGKKPYKC